MNNKIEIWEELLRQKTSVQSEIATSRDNAKLRTLSEWLGQELDLEAKFRGLMAEAENLIEGRQTPAPRTASAKINEETANTDAHNINGSWKFADLPKRERAGIAQEAFFARQKERGKVFKKVGRIYFRDDEGNVKGITYSSEKDNGKWFLNLVAGRFHEAVFLCQIGPQSVVVVHLPKAIVERYEKHLSKDHKGEVKFNVRRDGKRFFLDIPQPVGPVDVTAYVDKEELRCKRNDFQYK